MQRRSILAIILLASFALVAYIYLPVLDALAYGILLAYLSRPIAYKAGKIIGIPFASFLTLAILILAGFAVSVYVGTEVFVELSHISSKISLEQVGATGGLISDFFAHHPELAPIVGSFSSSLNRYVEFLSGYVLSFLIGMLNFFLTSILAFFVAFFLLKDGRKLKNVVKSLTPREFRSAINIIDRNLEGIFFGSVLSAVIVGLITFITFEVFGLPYASIVSISSAVLQFVPMVGPQIILIPGVLVAIALSRYADAIVLFALAVFLFFVPDNVIKPLILTKTTRINPILVLLSFIGGVLVLGPKGFIIGPIFLAIFDGLVRAWLKLE